LNIELVEGEDNKSDFDSNVVELLTKSFILRFVLGPWRYVKVSKENGVSSKETLNA
jgi:hypothetical protein